MPSSHTYSDGSAGFFRYSVSDGTHSHIQRVHVSFATIDNVTDPGSPIDQDTLITPEGDVNATARNFLAMMSRVTNSLYTLRVLDFQAVSGGAPTGAPIPLQPYTLTGFNTHANIPEAQWTQTFRDTEGAPASVRAFGGSTLWNPAVKSPVVVDWATNVQTALAAYLTGLARTGGVTYPAGMSKVVSHHGFPFAVALSEVSGLNNRLRREYRVK